MVLGRTESGTDYGVERDCCFARLIGSFGSLSDTCAVDRNREAVQHLHAVFQVSCKSYRNFGHHQIMYCLLLNKAC